MLRVFLFFFFVLGWALFDPHSNIFSISNDCILSHSSTEEKREEAGFGRVFNRFLQLMGNGGVGARFWRLGHRRD